MYIENKISPLIAQQFPSFYKEQGENFIAFLEAYYEWLESENQALYHSRKLFDTADIDKTSEDFIKHFKSSYLANLPDSALTDKRLLIKNILDLYRSKGTPRAYSLLFKMIFNEDIELYIPNEHLFKLSDGNWYIPKYIEVSSNYYLKNLEGKRVYTSSGNGTAVVESYTKVIRSKKTINILYLNNIQGEFHYGEKIYCDDLYVDLNGNDLNRYQYNELSDSEKEQYSLAITSFYSPIIMGSLSSISIEEGGSNHNIGDILYVDSGSGSEGKLRVSSIANDQSGKVDFKLINGGSGYSLNAVITITGGGGSSASFKIGGLVNKELLYLNTDIISDYESEILESNTMSIYIESPSGSFSAAGNVVISTANVIALDHTQITINTISNGMYVSNSTLGISLYAYRSEGSLMWLTGSDSELNNSNIVPGIIIGNSTYNAYSTINTVWPKSTITGNAVIVSSNSTQIDVSNVEGYFVGSSIITDQLNSNTATITIVERTGDWGFANSLSIYDNLDSIIGDVLHYEYMEVGTIAYLSNVNPGANYLVAPEVSIFQPEVYALLISDGNGNYKGNNAVVSSRVYNANGVVRAAEVIVSGFGYVPGETITAKSESNTNNESSITGISIVDNVGKRQGRWYGSKGFASDINYLQDSYFYQKYSYQILSSNMISKYEKFVRDIIHPVGMALFGKYSIKNVFDTVNNFTTFANTQETIEDFAILDLDFTTLSINSIATFSRNSNATYINSSNAMTMALDDEPRFEYYANGEFKGLLIEANSANLLKWINVNGLNPVVECDDIIPRVFDDQILYKAYRNLGTDDNNCGYGYCNVTANSTYTISTYVYLPDSFTGNTLTFTSDSTLTGANVNANLDLKNTWQRLSLTGTSTNNFVIGVFRLSTEKHNEYFYHTCWQIEENNYPTSYIPQTFTKISDIRWQSNGVTERAADSLYIANSNFTNFYNEIQRQGTIYIDAVFTETANSNKGVLAISNGSFNGSLYLNYSNTTNYWTVANSSIGGGAGQLTLCNVGPGRNKIAFTYDTDKRATCYNGSNLVYWATGGGLDFDEYNIMHIGGLWAGTSNFDGYMRRVKYYSNYKSNTDILAITS